ncbi:hypothetical protein IKE82_00565 [Candidatus Saccharibacteria bacterium]|nr:hypothetical protein [Candidatus Saccharibacteria bacterium]
MSRGGEHNNVRSSRNKTIVVGRTIGEKRERLETANERAAAREKDKRKNRHRIIIAALAFIAIIVVLIVLARLIFVKPPEEPLIIEPTPVATAEPTIEIIDEGSTTAGKITSRMNNYLGLLELDLKSYGYQPVKAVIPQGSIRQVNIYLDGYTGYLKTTIDRSASVTAEDADRMLRYLAGQGITDFEYVDLRLDGRAYWK